jgi:hypothetical protein
MSASPTSPAKYKRTAKSGCPDRLSTRVDEFCRQLLADFASRAARQPKGFRARVLALMAKRLPPFKKSPGRPKSNRVTLAAHFYDAQRREVREQRRARIDWITIARESDPTFVRIRSDHYRRVALKRLRDAVYVRVRNRSGRPGPASPSPAIER